MNRIQKWLLDRVLGPVLDEYETLEMILADQGYRRELAEDIWMFGCDRQ
jgi:hypothetical protein